MKQVYLPDGSSMPQLGQGTWQMGEDDNKYEREIAGLRHGIELGMTLIDTAEMYADGKAENIAGNAAKPFARESLYICDMKDCGDEGQPTEMRAFEHMPGKRK